MKYAVMGTGTPTLIFVHGLMGSATLWEKQTSYFQKTYRVITVDIYDESDAMPAKSPYKSFLRAADSIHAYLAGAPVDYIAIGHSAAGLTLCRLLQKKDRLLKGVVFVDSPLGLPSHEFWREYGLLKVSDTTAQVLVVDATVGTPQNTFRSFASLFSTCEHVQVHPPDHNFFVTSPWLLNDLIGRFLERCRDA